MDTTSVALLAFAGGSLMAAVISAFVKHFIFHPVISVRLDEKSGSYGSVTLLHLDNQGRPAGSSHQARYLRLRVENTGLSTIKDCGGYITKLTKRTAKGQVFPHEETLDLGWAHKNTNARDIPRGAFFHMDVATLELSPAGQRKLGLSHFFPTTLIGFFDEKATYEFEILIAADNARPCHRVMVKFAYDPQSDELQFTPVNRARFPWWIAWWRKFRPRPQDT
jgi:hypothetical protein